MYIVVFDFSDIQSTEVDSTPRHEQVWWSFSCIDSRSPSCLHRCSLHRCWLWSSSVLNLGDEITCFCDLPQIILRALTMKLFREPSATWPLACQNPDLWGFRAASGSRICCFASLSLIMVNSHAFAQQEVSSPLVAPCAHHLHILSQDVLTCHDRTLRKIPLTLCIVPFRTTLGQCRILALTKTVISSCAHDHSLSLTLRLSDARAIRHRPRMSLINDHSGDVLRLMSWAAHRAPLSGGRIAATLSQCSEGPWSIHPANAHGLSGTRARHPTQQLAFVLPSRTLPLPRFFGVVTRYESGLLSFADVATPACLQLQRCYIAATNRRIYRFLWDHAPSQPLWCLHSYMYVYI